MIARLQRHAPSLLGLGAIVALYGLFWALIRGRFDWVGGICLGIGLLAIAGGAALQPQRIWNVLRGRTARQGGNALVVSLAVIGILILLNVLAARHHKRFDLTAEQRFSLSKQTLQILAELQEPVTITAFMTPSYYYRQDVEDLLKEYVYHSDKISYEIVDPEQKPSLAREYGVTRDGTIIFEQGDRRQDALGYDEQAFTSALVKATRQEAKKVYFLTGHKERDPQSTEAAGYQQIAKGLEQDNYAIETLNLVVTPTVPSDASVVIIAAPTITPTADELKALNNYVDQGGSLCILGDPASDVTLDDLLGRWGLSARRDVVIDPASSFFGDVATPVASRFPYHEITKDLTGLTTIFPLAHSIATPSQPLTGTAVYPLVQSSAESWGETERNNQQVRLDAGQDTAGPLDLAVAATLELPEQSAEDNTKHARLVVFGDADLVCNELLLSVSGNLGNADLFLNAISWLAEEENLISIRSAETVQRTVLLTAPQVRLIMYASVILLPGLVAVAGFWVWWKRR